MSFLSLQPKEEKEEGESPLDGKIKVPLGGGGGGWGGMCNSPTSHHGQTKSVGGSNILR